MEKKRKANPICVLLLLFLLLLLIVDNVVVVVANFGQGQDERSLFARLSRVTSHLQYLVRMFE